MYWLIWLVFIMHVLSPFVLSCYVLTSIFMHEPSVENGGEALLFAERLDLACMANWMDR